MNQLCSASKDVNKKKSYQSALIVTVPSEVGRCKWLLSLFPYDRILESPKFSALSLSYNWLQYPSQKFKTV